MSRIKRFFKEWMLPISMTAGAAAYLTYHYSPILAPLGAPTLKIISVLQPVLLFLMLFLTFCRIDPRELRPQKWHLWLLLFQGGIFTALACLVAAFPGLSHSKVIIESALLCIICPTATAAAVVTGKLGGNISSLITYTILINLLTAILVPIFVPLIHPTEGMTFIKAFCLILAKVFPLLICPFLLAVLTRFCLKKLHALILRFTDLPFYIWAFSLMLAILMTVRAIVHSNVPLGYQAGIAGASLAACILQFWAGKKIGRHYGERITAGQSLGQKNTVFAIWMGYTFMTPVTSIAGGFYSIWHNCFNSWQLYRHEHGKK